MKVAFLAISIIVSFNSSTSTVFGVGDEYDIVEFYKGMAPSNGAAVLTTDEELVEPEVILIPIQLDIGKYAVEVTRMADDLYKIDGKNIYIKTSYCHEYALGQDAILKVESNYGYTKGEIIF